MATNYSQYGDVIDYTLAGDITKGQLIAGTEVCFVAIDSGATGDVVPVACEGVWTVAKKAGALLDFAVGEMAYGLTTGGVVKAVATGATVPIGYAVAAAATGDTTVTVKLSR